jgi:5'(3')-deoxyribonucleotidase
MNMSIEQVKMKRSYTITNHIDRYNIESGRCPDYALDWSMEENALYWDPSHNFYLGNNQYKSNDECFETLRLILSERRFEKKDNRPIIYCDLDGVLADFEGGVIRRIGKHPDEIKSATMWSLIRKTPRFYENLEWTEEGRELWDAIKQYNPIILTGCPNGNWAEEQKRNWCSRELGHHVRVVTCATKDKPKYCVHGAILIDDRDKIRREWMNKGGKFILYKTNLYAFIDLERVMNT